VSGEVALTPAVAASGAVEATSKPAAKHPLAGDPRKDPREPAPASASSIVPAPPPVAATLPDAAPVKKPSSAALTCFSDPFSGQIRPSSAGRPANAATFACKQDPFTGKYKKP
jgi:hypothetical protein